MRKIMPGDMFKAVAEGTVEKLEWQAFARYADRVEALEVGGQASASFPLDTFVEVDSQPNDVDYTDPLVVQRYQPKPEFRVDDLQDLIDALQEYKRNRR
jgi:hypothetical protein